MPTPPGRGGNRCQFYFPPAAPREPHTKSEGIEIGFQTLSWTGSGRRGRTGLVRLSLDLCCLNRPFDDQTQPRVSLEAQAVLLILKEIEAGSHPLCNST